MDSRSPIPHNHKPYLEEVHRVVKPGCVSQMRATFEPQNVKETRMKPFVNQSISGGLKGNKTLQNLSRDNLNSSTNSGNKMRQPIAFSPFSLRSEARVAKRKEFFQKLEEERKAKEAEKIKPILKAKMSVNTAQNILPPADFQLEQTRVKPLVNQSKSSGLKENRTLQALFGDNLNSSTNRENKMRQPIIFSPFGLRSEERAAKRREFFQKLEEEKKAKEAEKNAKEAEKIKPILKAKKLEEGKRAKEVEKKPEYSVDQLQNGTAIMELVENSSSVTKITNDMGNKPLKETAALQILRLPHQFMAPTNNAGLSTFAGGNNLVTRNSRSALIPLEGCCRSAASQLLNDRWAAIMHRYNDTSIDISERPVMYDSGNESAWGKIFRIPHQFMAPTNNAGLPNFASELHSAMRNAENDLSLSKPPSENKAAKLPKSSYKLASFAPPIDGRSVSPHCKKPNAPSFFPFSLRTEERAAKRKEFFENLEEERIFKKAQQVLLILKAMVKSDLGFKRNLHNTRSGAKVNDVVVNRGKQSPNDLMNKIPPAQKPFGRNPATPSVDKKKSSENNTPNIQH